MGFLGVTRRFASKEDLTSALIMGGISLAHYGRAVGTVDRAPGEISDLRQISRRLCASLPY